MKDISAVLEKLGIAYVKHEHSAVFTCEEAEKWCGNIPGGKSKSLFLRNRNGDKHFLVIMEAEKKLDMKGLAVLLGESKLSFASEERLQKYLKLTPGAVSPFGLINDEKKEVVVIIDQDLLKHSRLSYHPNVNTATLELATKDFRKFLVSTGNTVKILQL
jgi:Ala-tRNA(Pro) deacylase